MHGDMEGHDVVYLMLDFSPIFSSVPWVENVFILGQLNSNKEFTNQKSC